MAACTAHCRVNNVLGSELIKAMTSSPALIAAAAAGPRYKALRAFIPAGKGTVSRAAYCLVKFQQHPGYNSYCEHADDQLPQHTSTTGQEHATASAHMRKQYKATGAGGPQHAGRMLIAQHSQSGWLAGRLVHPPRGSPAAPPLLLLPLQPLLHSCCSCCSGCPSQAIRVITA